MLTRTGSAAPADPDDDAGMTLTELLVGMTLLSIVMIAAMNFFISTVGTANRVTDQSLTQSATRTAMNQIVAALQVADTPIANAGYSTARFLTAPLTTANPPAALQASEVTFFGNVSTGSRSGTTARTAPTELDFGLSGGRLVQTQWAPCASLTTAGCAQPGGYQTAYPTSATSTTTLLTSVTALTFAYCTDDTDPAAQCTPTLVPASVAAVQITLTVAGRTGSTPQTMKSTVAVTGAVS